MRSSVNFTMTSTNLMTGLNESYSITYCNKDRCNRSNHIDSNIYLLMISFLSILV
jgi:hypothetical protein